jgi:hypothetical protein
MGAKTGTRRSRSLCVIIIRLINGVNQATTLTSQVFTGNSHIDLRSFQINPKEKAKKKRKKHWIAM